MRGRLAATWVGVRDSFWFLPALMALGGVVLAELVINLDERVGLSSLRGLPWVYGGSADGARSMLAVMTARDGWQSSSQDCSELGPSLCPFSWPTGVA
ncbi:hypothetical protein GCM10008955_38010 [Deinococcus malanensis]|uniref:Uncharacterized protein n=1 Tax=Deinococcus malanensis TaxID=1706855 RepID=A0ABQ2F1J2_9DEIO|nr:DUF2254 family protein [Deinococcus malanensis]GGK40626.1 hypothetical protein GCM10008955_38010 [Deinococcus malanensis]